MTSEEPSHVFPFDALCSLAWLRQRQTKMVGFSRKLVMAQYTLSVDHFPKGFLSVSEGSFAYG